MTWLNKSYDPSGVIEGLRGLTKRGLIVMTPQDDPTDEFRQRYPDRLKAIYSLPKEPHA